MPLIHGKSKKAFEHNVEAEMHAGKPQDQSLAIAYSVKRKSKKKMAEGGKVTAANEARPMPKEENNDRHEIARQGAAKAITDSQMTSRPDIKQSQGAGMKVTKIKRPKMVASNVLQAHLRDEEDDLESSAAPASPAQQPAANMDEEGPNRKGPKQAPTDARSMNSPTKTHKHTADRNMQSINSPSEDEGTSNARSKNEEGPDRKGPDTKDLHMKMMAEGGEASDTKEDLHEVHVRPDTGYGKVIRIYKAEGGYVYDSSDQPEEENADEEHNSIAAAIMARRGRMHAAIDSGAHDMDEAVRMAEGGQVDLSINADEEPNNEDQMSFEALKKENYSESAGLDQLDQPEDSNLTGDEREDETSDPHDMVSTIRKKMKSRRQMPQE